ncbi:hypothetical protein TWF281_011925 [Arthrobotrys megalospora]
MSTNPPPPSTMKRSHYLRTQRERWSADLPYRGPEPTLRPDDTLPQPPQPPKKRFCLAPTNPALLASSEKQLRQSPPHNTSKRNPRVSNYAKLPNHGSSPAPNGVQGPYKDHTTARRMDMGDILAQLEESYRDRGGPALSQARIGTRPYELTPPDSDRKEVSSPSSSPDTEIRVLGKHFQSSVRGPRAEEPATLGGFLSTRPKSTMAIKRTGHRQIDYQAYREFMRPPKVYTYCSQCKGMVPNCPLCGLMKKLGVPPEKPPSAEQMIRENPEYYWKLFGFEEEKPKAQIKPAKKRREAPQPTASRPASLYPNGERPAWDTPPEKGPEYTSWNPNDPPNQKSLWDEFVMPQEPIPNAPPSNKPILAAERPKDKISEPYARAQRPDLNQGKDICFSCWNYGHISKHCPESLPRDVRQQEARRVIKRRPLPPAWRAVLQNHNMNPMTLEEAEETLRLCSLGILPNSETLEEKQTQITDSVTKLPPLPPDSIQTEIANPTNSSTLMTTSKIEGEISPSNSIPDFETCNVPDTANASDPSMAVHPSSDIPSNSFFKPDNARYKPVGKGVDEKKLNRLPPILKIPNEIISNIIRIILEDDGIPTGQSTQTVFEEESSLQNKNLQLDSIRKINNLWRSLCQAELYRSIPMTSLQTLRRFTECVAKYPDLSVLVREVKVYIPFMTIDGWTRSDIPRAVDEEKYTATTSARCLSLIIAACPNLSRLDASFAGALQSLSYLTKAHSTLTHLSLDDCLPRKNDIRQLGKTVKCFPNLQLLQLETSHERPVEWRNLTISVGDILNRRVLLTSIGFKDFPIHDVFLERALPNFPSLRTLQIEGCPGVTPKGLAKTIMGLENPRLTTLTFIRSKMEANGRKTGQDNPHLCEAIALKLGPCLSNLVLGSVPVCEKLATTWSQLEGIAIQGKEFRGCSADTTETSFQEAMAASGITSLRLDPFIYFGAR